MNFFQSATFLVWVAIACVMMQPKYQPTQTDIEQPTQSQSKTLTK
jgi:hypothetical protein